MIIGKQEKIEKIRTWLGKTKLDPDVVKRTLKMDADNVSTSLLLEASKKLIKINKKEEEPDDRDHLRYSKVLGLEDYLEEHILRDAGRVQQKAALKMQQKKNLSWLNPGFFTPQVRSTIIGNPLAQNVEGINPLEHWDNSHRVTKLGPGGITSLDAIPDISRQVSTSTFGFIDPVHIAESANVGVTSYIAQNVVKGKDNKFYRVMKDKNGKLGWYSHEDVLNRQVKIPESSLARKA